MFGYSFKDTVIMVVVSLLIVAIMYPELTMSVLDRAAMSYLDLRGDAFVRQEMKVGNKEE